MKSTPILIKLIYIDKKRIKMNKKTSIEVLENIREVLKKRYNTNRIYFHYEQRLK